jgi:xeroderma pigmentosum group C-complementing protein
MTGFKDHPLCVHDALARFSLLTLPTPRYALERHLRRDEIVHPLKELGKFRGEPVYPRANVLQLKAAENWMRSGRQVRAGAQPMKWVPQRAVTVHRKRELELARVDQGGAGESAMQGMYALSQTELYTPPAVVNVSRPLLIVRCEEFG